MNLITNYFRDLYRATVSGWNRFWFTAVDPATLGVIRILGGTMLFYTHLVWTLGLNDFFGPHAWLTPETIGALPDHSPFAWSYFYWIHSPVVLWTVHILALVVFALLTVGLWTRAMSILAFLATVSYANRMALAQFGLDDTIAMLALYLMIGPSGAAYSIDSWLERRRNPAKSEIEPRIGANVAIRLLQVHMCIIYLFSGLGKLKGDSWWNGDALLMVTANQEYQSFDLTWLIRYPWIASLLTQATVLWETFYCALVWPRITRPITLAIAVCVHLGIGAFFGMWTFGLAMIIANLAFVSPWVVRRVLDRRPRAVALESKTSQGRPPAKSQRSLVAAGQMANKVARR